MRALTRLSLAIDRLNRHIGQGAAWLTLLMVLIGAFNAIARYLQRDLGLDLASNAYLEAQWYLFSIVFLFGAPYALRLGSHVRVDVIYGNRSARGKAWIDLLGAALFLVPFCAFAIWISHDFVRDSFAVREGSLDPGGLPRWPLKVLVPIAFLLLGLQGISEIIKRVLFLRGVPAEQLGLEESSTTPAEVR